MLFLHDNLFTRFCLLAFLLVLTPSPSLAQLNSMQDLGRLFPSHRESKFFHINGSTSPNPFFQYSQETRKNPLFLTKSDLTLNMDRSIEAITNNDGIGSNRYLVEVLHYGKFIGNYKAKYDRHLNKGHRALDTFFDQLSQSPYSYRFPSTREVSLLIAPFAERQRRREQFINSAPTRTPFYYPPILSTTTPLNVPFMEPDDDMSDLPLAPRYPEKPAELPVLLPPQNSQVSETVSLAPPTNRTNDTGSLPDLHPVAQPDRVEPVHRSPVQLLYDQGLEAFNQRNYPKAKQLFEKSLSLSPDTTHTQFARGISLFYSGDYHASLNAIQRSYELAQKQNIPALTLWQIPIHTRDFHYHYKKLARRIQQNPNDSEALSLMLLLTQTGFSIVSQGLL